MRERTIPMRRCVGCMTSFPKDEIVRFVVSKDMIVIDSTGRISGRGAYICRSLACFDASIKKKRLSYALGVSIGSDELVCLREAFTKKIDSANIVDVAEVAE